MWSKQIVIIALSSALMGCWSGTSVPVSPTATPPTPELSPVTKLPATLHSTLTPTSTLTTIPDTSRSTRTPSPPASLASTLSASPTTSPTVEHPLITSFTATPTEIDPGDPVRLSWETIAETVTLCTTMRGGPLAQCWSVEAVGSRTVTTHELDRVYAMYLLFAESGDLRDQAAATVTIRCPDTWFFEDPPDACPYAAVHSRGAAQPFEHGLMLWVEELDAIFVLYSDAMASPRWDRIPDQWEPGMAESDPSLTPPEGLYQPVRGFGLVWRGPVGATITVRGRLGWATRQEAAIDTAYQCDSAAKYNTCYLLGPEGIVVLEPERSGWHLYANAE